MAPAFRRAIGNEPSAALPGLMTRAAGMGMAKAVQVSASPSCGPPRRLMTVPPGWRTRSPGCGPWCCSPRPTQAVPLEEPEQGLPATPGKHGGDSDSRIGAGLALGLATSAYTPSATPEASAAALVSATPRASATLVPVP